jgi:hypothetical protein
MSGGSMMDAESARLLKSRGASTGCVMATGGNSGYPVPGSGFEFFIGRGGGSVSVRGGGAALPLVLSALAGRSTGPTGMGVNVLSPSALTGWSRGGAGFGRSSLAAAGGASEQEGEPQMVRFTFPQGPSEQLHPAGIGRRSVADRQWSHSADASAGSSVVVRWTNSGRILLGAGAASPQARVGVAQLEQQPELFS